MTFAGYRTGRLCVSFASVAGCAVALVLLGAHVPAEPPAAQATRAPNRLAANDKVHPALVSRLVAEHGPVKGWVFFADKGAAAPGAPLGITAGAAVPLDPRAVQRRLLRGSAAKRAGQVFDEHDLPVAAAYVDAVTATGARLCSTSRWLNAVSVWATPEQFAQIAGLPFVQRLQPVARGGHVEPDQEVEANLPPLPSDPQDRGRLDYGYATGQLTQINLIALHNAGYTGQGVIVGILDTGFHRTHVAFNNPAHPLNIVAQYDFVNNDPNPDIEPNDPPQQYYHGTWILGTLASYQPGALVGAAYEAAFILCKTENTASETPVEEDYYVAGLEFVEAHGGDMVTSSLGYIDWYTQADLDGQTAVTTIAVNVATANGLLCCSAAGNEGHDSDPGTSHLIAPADALQVITCGAVNYSGLIASFSSDGPTADGRVKPELLAQGVSTATVSVSSDTAYSGVSGTSLSTPLVAGAVACLIQAHPQWTVDQVRAALFQTASNSITQGTYDPLYVEGYGIADAYEAARDCNHNGVPDLVDIATGASLDNDGNGIPDECELPPGVCRGDLNCDGSVSFRDINPFVLYLSDSSAWQARFPGCDPRNGDINGDGTGPSFKDINPFVVLLGSQSLPIPCP